LSASVNTGGETEIVNLSISREGEWKPIALLVPILDPMIE
jgi:hypothetical protein